MRVQKSPSAYLGPTALSLFLLLTIGCSAETVDEEAATATPAGPVVLVVADSLRADHLWLYGYDEPTSPFLDWVAQEGLVFEHAYANSSFIAQSISSLMTGRLPSSGGSVGLEAQPSEEASTLAELFSRSGYTTGIVSSQPLLGRRGFTRGFQDIQIDHEAGGWSGASVTARALDFVDTVGEAPFFLYVHYLDPHQPHTKGAFTERIVAANYWEPRRTAWERYEVAAPGPQPPSSESEPASAPHPEGPPAEPRPEPPQDLEALLTGYDSEIAYTDDNIRQLVEGLRERGLLEDTTFIVTSSTGAELLERGEIGTAKTLYQEVLRVPLLLLGPGIPNGERVERPVSLVDLLPTLRQVSGLPEGALDEDGRPFLAASESGDFRPRVGSGPIISELVFPDRVVLRSVVSDGWKYVRTHQLDEVEEGADPDLWGPVVSEEIYHLGTDPYERGGADEPPEEVLTALRETLDRYAAFCAANGIAPRLRKAVAVDPAEIDKLEALGYL